MCYRIAVREVEAWLLADRIGFANYFDVPISDIPERPDELTDPSESIVNIVRRSRSRVKRRAVVPATGSSVAFGPLYEAELIEFGSQHWSLPRAAGGSDSLARARRALQQLGKKWRAYLRGHIVT
jgi:hypothetical protein